MEEMKGQYAEDEDFARIYDQIVNGQSHEHYTLKSDFLMMHGKLCITKQLRPKVLIERHAPPYIGHRGIDVTVKAVDTFFYWPTLRRDTSMLFASPWSRFFALAIPMASATRLAVNGFGILKDEGFVKSISREGTARELLRGPFYYALILSCCTAFFWRDSPVGMTAIAIMCGGDGVADIVGRRIGVLKLPHNTRKSWAGSISMFVFGFALSVCFLYYFSTLGYYFVDWTSAVYNVALISFVATVVESLPLSAFLDDNISVPLVSVILGMALFSNSM
ncbi:hypothetical protein L7F22_009923 [Adiantum nelumboides]|nr:hypothetical protein [Adiantum nelumboides]